MGLLRFILSLLLIVGLVIAQDSDGFSPSDNIFSDARVDQDLSNDPIKYYDTIFDDKVFGIITTVPVFNLIFSSRCLIPIISLFALASLHKSDFEARVFKVLPPNIDPSIPEQGNRVWVVLRPFIVVIIVLMIQKIFLYSIMFYSLNYSLKERITITDSLLLRPDQYLCYVIAYSISNSFYTSFKITSFMDYLVACFAQLFSRRIIRDLYLYLPRSLWSFLLIILLSIFISWVYTSGGPAQLIKTLTQPTATPIHYSIYRTSSSSTIFVSKITPALRLSLLGMESGIESLSKIVNSLPFQLSLLYLMTAFILNSFSDTYGMVNYNQPSFIWKVISFFSEDIKILLPIFLSKWTKLLPSFLANSSLQVVSSIGDSLFFLILYLCNAVVLHAREKLGMTLRDKVLPLGV